MQRLILILESQFCSNLLLALLHSLWQSIIIAGFLLLYLKSKTARSANSRYTASVFALIAIVICLLFTWSVLNYEPVVSIDTSVTADSEIPRFSPILSAAKNISTAESVEAQSSPEQLAATGTTDFNWKPPMMCLWLIGMVIMLLRAILIMVGGSRLQRQCTVLEDENILRLVEQLRKNLGIFRRIRVAVSKHITVPGVIGFIRPVLLLPASMVTGVPTDDLQAILAHELAHIKRYDYLVNFCQMVIEAILFFNPAVWWISRQIRIEREVCCDNAGIATTGRPIRYAEVLIGWAKKIQKPNMKLAAAAMGFGKKDDRGSMLERIQRIVGNEHRPRLKVSWHIAFITLIISFAALTALWQGTNYTVALAGQLVNNQSRTIHFPKDRSIGEIYLQDWDFPKDVYVSVGWEAIGFAQGDITIPGDKALRLDISKDAWQDGNPLDGLGPDDIQMLSFSKYNKADDSVLEDVSSLTGLEVLNLSGTQITGTGFKYLAALKKLNVLFLAAAKITDKELEALTELPSLEHINFNGAPIGNDGMIHIGKIKTLKYLVLSGTSVDDEGLEHLKDLTSLRLLYLFLQSSITDEGLKHLAGLSEMETLNLQYTQVTDAGLVHLKGMQKLKELRLEGTKVGDKGLEHLKGLESLEYLALPFETAQTEITDEGVAHLSQLHSLKKLYLLSNAITSRGLEILAQLKSLEEFDTGGIEIDDAGIAKIAQFPALKSLWIQRSQVTDAGLAELKKSKNLTTLRIFESPVTCEGLGVLKECPNLTELVLYNMYKGDTGFSSLAEITSLDSLDISSIEVTDDDLASLSVLTNLKQLRINTSFPNVGKFSEFTDEGMQHLGKLKSLESLYISGSEITDVGLTYLEGLENLKNLGISDSKITEEGLIQLKKKMPALQY